MSVQIPCVNPATGEQFDSVSITSPQAVQEAHQAMRAAFPRWREMPVQERAKILRKFQALLLDSLDEITAMINRDCGKSRQDALLELLVTINLLHEYCKQGPRWLAREKIPRGLAWFKRCYVEYRPWGVVAVIAPWNYPFTLAVGPVVSALLAGNTVLLKPSEVTAATGKLIENLFQRIPELAPFVRVLHGDGSTGAALVQSAPDFIFLTGSGPTARKIMQAAAENLTPVACELGGKDAMIVLEDVDVQKVARWGEWGAFFNAGQTCMAIERVYVVEAIYDDFVKAAVAEAGRLQVGYGEQPETPYHFGAITMPRQAEIIEMHLEDAIQKGAKILSGGKRQGMFFEPTIVVDVDHSMRLMREETFGPILPIMKVKDEAEAIRWANDCPYGLGGSVWSRNIARAERVAHRLQAASVLVNDSIVQFGIPLLPFGGVKQSGSGRTHGREGLLAFTQSHSYVVGQPPPSFDISTILRQPGHYHLSASLMRLVFGTTFDQRMRPLLKILSRKTVQRNFVLAGLMSFLLWLWGRKKA